MKKIISLFIFIFLASCGQASTPSQTEKSSVDTQSGQVVVETKTETTIETKTENAENFQKLIDSASKKITQTENFNVCMKNYVNSCLDATASAIANEQKDASFCNELSSETSQNSCRLGVVLSDMYTHKDATKCDIITEKDLQNSCKIAILEAIALENKDVKKCEEIASLSEKPEQQTEYKESCMLKVFASETSLDVKKCESLTIEHYKSTCKTFTNIQK